MTTRPASPPGHLVRFVADGAEITNLSASLIAARKDWMVLENFGTDMPLTAQCTTAKDGRTITIGPHEARLAAARQAEASAAWQADYRATRPKVERKIGHLMRRRRRGVQPVVGSSRRRWAMPFWRRKCGSGSR